MNRSEYIQGFFNVCSAEQIYIKISYILPYFCHISNLLITIIKQGRSRMKQCDKDLISFLKKYNLTKYHPFSNDRATRKVVNRLCNRNICKQKYEVLDNGFIWRSVALR